MSGPTTLYARRAKPVLDKIGAAILLLLLGPVIFVIAILTRIALGSPILFVQVRPGLHERPFRIFKFRTMTEARGEGHDALPDAERLTRFGRWLRASSLDELPQLYNVLKGDLSFVGPRPLLMEYLPHYSQEQRRRHAVRPGLTGLAQVSGRNALEWPERLRLDVEYVIRLSPMLDFRILSLTLSRVIRGEGINAPGHATVSSFTDFLSGRSSPR